ncbi:MAG: iron-sulfur cluster assembly scaffold protein [Candidatus Thermoplasmatota archaeon]|jgi:nitrogen fixation NifU-like protein|nr:iron-sulfur cluster assembly scaffold protein [Candidatus Thermoplasmatota archaeon]
MTDENSAEFILDHYKNPRNHGVIQNPSSSITEMNPLCGDTVHFTVLIENGIMKDIKFIGQGCSISQASASILSEYVLNKNISDIKNMTETDFLGLIGMDLGPNREKCALLSLNALKKILDSY